MWFENETVRAASTSQPSSCNGNDAALLPARTRDLVSSSAEGGKEEDGTGLQQHGDYAPT